jgi:hypothetical protein
LTWSDNTMRFNINSTIKIDHGLTCLLPLLYEGKKVDNVITNGNEQTYSVKSMKGFQYVWVTVTPGSNYRIEVHYK